MGKTLPSVYFKPKREIAREMVAFVAGGGSAAEFRKERGITPGLLREITRIVPNFQRDLDAAKRSRVEDLNEDLIQNVVKPAAAMKFEDLHSTLVSRQLSNSLKMQKLVDSQMEIELKKEMPAQGDKITINLNVDPRKLDLLEKLATPVVGSDGIPKNPPKNIEILKEYHTEVNKNDSNPKTIEAPTIKNPLPKPRRRPGRPRKDEAENPPRDNQKDGGDIQDVFARYKDNRGK